jgi:N-acetylmuramoyl-L-alanine amidase
MDVQLPERMRAHRANRQGADLIVSFQLAEPDDCGVFSFEAQHSRSEAGARLARQVAGPLGVEPRGRATAILRETRSPAVVVALPRLDADVGRRVVDGIEAFFRESGRQTHSEVND